MYQLGSIDFQSKGIIPGKAFNSNIAISGAWDMPVRTGKTHHIWDEENGLEPYLRADELFYAGRDIIFHGYIKAGSKQEAARKVTSLFLDINNMTSLSTFSCKWGSWQVYVKDQIQINYIAKGYCSIEIIFREPIVNMEGDIPVSTNSEGIDGISFSDLGLTKVKTSNQFNRSNSKKFSNTNYGSESFKITKSEFREFNLRFFINKISYMDFIFTIKGLIALFCKPGPRTLKLDDYTTREFFIKDGFQVTNVRTTINHTSAYLDIKIAEIRLLENWNKFSDGGLVLVDKHGQPLAELIKMI